MQVDTFSPNASCTDHCKVISILCENREGILTPQAFTTQQSTMLKLINIFYEKKDAQNTRQVLKKVFNEYVCRFSRWIS